MQRLVFAFAAVVALAGGFSAARVHSAQAAKRPAVAGAWTGTWGIYAPPPLAGEPAPAPKAANYPPLRLDCTVVEKDGRWQATFEGEAGRPYKYTVTMLGRQAGDVVLFQGSADLGEKDGGVYDWIGRATDREFVGFYTSSKYTGSFRLARPR